MVLPGHKHYVSPRKSHEIVLMDYRDLFIYGLRWFGSVSSQLKLRGYKVLRGPEFDEIAIQ